DALQAQSPANAAAVAQAVPQLQKARDDRGGLAAVTRDLFTTLAPADDVAAAEIHWHTCASVMARLGQDFAWALRRAAEALLDRRMLEATLSGSYAGTTPTEQDVVLTVCFQPDACDACRETGGYESGTDGQGTLRFTVAEAREQVILPHRACRNAAHGAAGFCRCRYKAVEGARQSTATRGPHDR
ncbi:MAG TPA: hypothetical protein VJQ44_13890, partial [Gemmatimonadales bacterium]|nr:hypothetical protein [Gemmatimonadales bacterium]